VPGPREELHPDLAGAHTMIREYLLVILAKRAALAAQLPSPQRGGANAWILRLMSQKCRST